MNGQLETEGFGTEAIAGALERLNCLIDHRSEWDQGSYGAWDNA